MRLASADRPDVLCLQEVPVWALDELDDWSGHDGRRRVAQRPTSGRSPRPPRSDAIVTELDHGLLRSAFTGQANAILLGPRAAGGVPARDPEPVPLSTRAGPPSRARSRSSGSRGQGAPCLQAVRVRAATRRSSSATSTRPVHPTSASPTPSSCAQPCSSTGWHSRTSRFFSAGTSTSAHVTRGCSPDLTAAEWGFSGPTPTGIDHVLVRGLDGRRDCAGRVERRLYDGRLLSDHAPVEREVA